MTREEAIKWLEEAVNDTNNDFDLCSDALKKELLLQKDVFEMAVSALTHQQGEWISVKERLPDDEKDGETVLAVVSGKPHENITLCHALMTAGYFPGEGWVLNEYPEWENPTITHWMPLPEPPEEKESVR